MNIIDINNNSPRFTPVGPVWVNVTENSGDGTAIIFDPVVHVADLDEVTFHEQNKINLFLY